MSDVGEVTALLRELMARPSVTPADHGCQALIAERLKRAGFACTHLRFGDVDNLWAVHDAGQPGATVVLAGHTDVVPTGPLDAWTSPPFTPTERGGLLFGRGAADMKASIAAFVVAAERLVAAQPQHPGRIALLLTSDEEGPSVDGTVRVVGWLRERGERLDACIVGEPTCVARLGDMVKNGRRGSLTGRLTVLGKQGHVAYPQLADNPVHRVAPALAELCATIWDAGNAHFPPTSFQVSNIHAGTGAGNVIPATCVVDFNFRFSTDSTPEGLQARVAEVLARHGVPHELAWVVGGRPFLTPQGALVDAMRAAIAAETGVAADCSTTGGTSDGRFIATICPEVVEFGPVNASIHQVDEHIRVADIEPLARIYARAVAAVWAGRWSP